jgi:hypothetical protein
VSAQSLPPLQHPRLSFDDAVLLAREVLASDVAQLRSISYIGEDRHAEPGQDTYEVNVVPHVRLEKGRVIHRVPDDLRVTMFRSWHAWQEWQAKIAAYRDSKKTATTAEWA